MQSTQSSLDSTLFASEKMKELEEVEQLIERLRSQLLAAEHRRTIIQGELASSNLTRKGIQTLPLELLCVIFSLIDETQRERNRRLALVCKSWRTVVNETPQFWTQILVKWNGSAQFLVRSWNYMGLCIEGSKGLLLDVTVDFTLMPTFDFYIWNLIGEHLDQIESQIRLCSLEEDAATQLATLLCDHCHKYDSLVANTIRKICDTEGPHCRSLNLSLPDHCDGVDNILSNISAGAASLAKLEYRMRRFLDEPVPIVTLLSPMRSLKHLETNQNVDLHPTVLSTLEHLDLEDYEASYRLLISSGSCCFSLRFLSIALLDGIQLQGKLYSPSLHTLILQGSGQEAFMSVLDSPSLDTIHFDQMRLPQYATKPILSVKNLSLCVNAWTDNRIPSSIAQFRKTLPWFPNLVFCSLMTRPAICRAVSEEVSRAIKNVRADGTALVLLERINIVYLGTKPRKVYCEVDVLLRNDGAEEPCELTNDVQTCT